jgi:ABC-2 type transport system permease protein
VIALVRTEFTKAAVRTRTLVITLVLVGIPSLILFAINARASRPGADQGEGEGLFRLAHLSGLLVPAPVLSVMSAFLLVVIAGTIAGDSVAGDAAWGNLRYLLMRPVPRGRLLVAKAVVAAALIWACTILVVVAALAGGLLLFGAHPVTFPGTGPLPFVDGFRLGTGALLFRTAVATGYVALGYSGLLALGMLFSTLTDNATSAIGATVGVYIVSEILDGVTQLGQVRYALPTHYLDAWRDMFLRNHYPSDMAVGLVVQAVYLVVFGAAAILWFRRKDIKS